MEQDPKARDRVRGKIAEAARPARGADKEAVAGEEAKARARPTVAEATETGVAVSKAVRKRKEAHDTDFAGRQEACIPGGV